MDNFSDGVVAGMAAANNNNGYGYNNGWGYGFGGDWIWIIVLFALWQNGGFGNFGGFGGGNRCGSPCATQADLAAGFNNSAVLSGINGIDSALCQGFNGVNTAILQSSHNTDNAICNLGYNVQSGFNSLSHQISDCCCTTQRAIDGVNYNMATQFASLQQAMCNNTRDIIDAQTSGTRAVLDFLVTEKMAVKDARIAQLENQVGRAEQNATLRAAIDASTAEIIRRTGNEYPSPAYVVQPPQPVTFPTNCCGQFAYANNGCGNGCGGF